MCWDMVAVDSKTSEAGLALILWVRDTFPEQEDMFFS